MTQLRWTLSPEDFVRALGDWAQSARRQAGASRGAKRHVGAVMRRRRRWYMKLHGLSALPQANTPLDAAGSWERDAPDQLAIVVPPRNQGDEDAGATTRADRRKLLRHAIHHASKSADTKVTLVNAATGPRRLPPIARNSAGRRVSARGLYLEELGVAIMPGLDADMVAALKADGALVIPNELIGIDDPADVPEEAVTSPSAAGIAPHLQAIGIAEARRAGLTGKGVVLGVLDTGIEADHPEFADKTIAFMAFKRDGTRNPIAAKDYGSHGTHVAALAAGRTVGVAPDADLMVAAVLTEAGPDGLSGYTAQILAGLNWLASVKEHDRPVDIVNASLGGADALGHRRVVAANRETGTLVVAAIGNNGRKGRGHHLSPGMLDCAIGVGAIDDQGQIAPFSDWGPCFSESASTTESKPDIVAPGVSLNSAVPGKRYAAKSGTSMACPIVTGAGALLIEKYPNLRGDPDAITTRILGLIAPLPPQTGGHPPDRGGRGMLSLQTI